MQGKSFDIPCRISIEQSERHFHAHVELVGEGGEVPINPGDKVRVHGAPIRIAFGETAHYERTATVTRAGPIERMITRLAAYFDLKELYEVSFNPGRIT